MKITRVFFRGFGRWVGQSFRFSEGINLIEAPNESGKSTLLQGMTALLYGAKREGVNKRQRASWHERFQPWQGNEYGGEIDFQIGDRTYRLVRSLNWPEDREQLVDLKTGRDITGEFPFDARKDRRFMESLLGLSREMFRRIVFLTSESLAGEQQVVERIRRLIAQGEETEITPVIHFLESEIQRIGKTPQARTKPYGMAVSRRNSLERDVMEIRSMLQELDRDKLRLGEMRERLRALKAEREKAEKRLSRLRERLDAAKRRTALDQRRKAASVQAESLREKLNSLAELEREEAVLQRKRAEEEPPHLLTREEWEELRKLAEERNDARRRLSENAERYRKVKEELAFLEEEKGWLLELDEEGLQRHLYLLEEVLKREEEIVQAAEGEAEVGEDETDLRRLEEDCMAMSDLQEREDVYRREKRRCEEEVSFLARQVELQEQRREREKMLREALDALTPPVPTDAPWKWMWISGLALTVVLIVLWPWGSVATLLFSAFAAYRWMRQRAMDREALESWELRRRKLEEDWNKLQEEAKSDGAGTEKWDTQRMLQDARNHLEQLERALDDVLRKQEAILRRWDAGSSLDLYRKRDRIQERKREVEWARSAREKNRNRLAELRREAGTWSESLLNRLGPFDPEEWHASLSQVLREAREVKERVRRLRADLETLRADSSRWEEVRAEAVRRLQPWFDRLGTDQLSEWEEWFLRSERVREMDERLKEIGEKVARLKQLREAEAWDKRLEELERELAELEERLRQEESEGPDEEELRKQVMQAEAEFRTLEERCRKQSDEVLRLSTRIHARLDRIPPLSDMETLLKEAEERVAELEEERRALEIAKEELTAALRQVQEDIAPRLAPHASHWIREVTRGRYENLLIDPTDGIRLSVFVPETGERKEIEQLSQGTIDQMYFALRLALIRLFSEAGKTPLPVILDDSLVHFDEDRLREALRILGKLSGEHQIFLCTCQNRERLLLEEEGIAFRRIHLETSPQEAASGTR